jgi:hypothetical protein
MNAMNLSLVGVQLLPAYSIACEKLDLRRRTVKEDPPSAALGRLAGVGIGMFHCHAVGLRFERSQIFTPSPEKQQSWPNRGTRGCSMRVPAGAPVQFVSPSRRTDSITSSNPGTRLPIGKQAALSTCPCGIVWLNPFRAKNGHQDGHQNERSAGPHSQAGLGVRFGVHSSTKRGRFGGFQRL